MTLLGSFLFLLLFFSPASVTLTSEAGVSLSLDSLESLLSLCCFFFLSFLTFLEGLGLVEADAGVEAGPLEVLELSPQFTAPCVWTL